MAARDSEIPDTGLRAQRLLLSVDEACDLLSIGKTTFYREIMEGRLRLVRIGGRALLPRQFLDEYVETIIGERDLPRQPVRRRKAAEAAPPAAPATTPAKRGRPRKVRDPAEVAP